ncbi:UBX domain-containing protein [Mycena kentingensis (nom. inval.)]|nr:UBX domain-containing protein [Mycena kentingensis (nom. inval.)]
MSTLTDDQQNAVAQLKELTGAEEDDYALAVLSSVDFDVQKACELVFGGGPPPRPPTPPQIPQFDIDDSEQYQPVIPRPAAAWSLANLFAWPFQLLSSLLRFLFGFLRIPLPRPFAFNPTLFRPLRRPPPRADGGADRWVRELEEETGAQCLSAAASGVETSQTAGPSTLTHRAPPAGRKVLPDFTLGTYEDVLRTCQRDLRIGCVVLVSEEHDDVLEFKRSTLTDSAFVRVLQENEVVVWGGDVRDREAYSVSHKLSATTYPFVAFLALQPRPGSSSSTSPTMTILSRHQGSAETTASKLVAHIENQLLPRVNPFLARLRGAQHAAAADRALREEQDRAFQEAAARDTARIQAYMEEEARRKREAEAARIAKEDEAARIQREAEERQLRQAERATWRQWTRLAVSQITEDAGGERLAIRFPDGRRVVRRFAASDSLTFLYAFVDAELATSSGEGSDVSPTGHHFDDLERAMDEQVEASADADSWWGFQLMLAYPRREVLWSKGKVGDVDCLKGGAQLVVQLNSPVPMNNGDLDDDGYVSED